MQVWDLFLRWNYISFWIKLILSFGRHFDVALPPKANSFGRSIFTSAAFVYNFVGMRPV
ncbi:MAG: hypothetical protein ACKERF_01650 [Candidatus Hodgkinia cicadicola]